MEFLKAFIYGIVEGITEWLPISSTGHLILLNSFMPLNITAQFFYIFKVTIQLGAILAVVINFWKKVWPFGVNNSLENMKSFKASESKSENSENDEEDGENSHFDVKGIRKVGKGYSISYEKDYNEKISFVNKDIVSMWFKIIVACMPAAIVGLFLDDYIEKYFSSNKSVAIALIIVGILFWVVETVNKKEPKIKDIKDITYRTAIIIGGFQLLAAIFPGVSRSGATIIGALMIGVSREVAVEFSFFMAIPVMFGASILRFIRIGVDFSEEEFAILSVAMFGAFLVSNIVINILVNFVKEHNFKCFAYYRIILGIAVIGISMM